MHLPNSTSLQCFSNTTPFKHSNQKDKHPLTPHTPPNPLPHNTPQPPTPTNKHQGHAPGH